jgi:hypothetical protein
MTILTTLLVIFAVLVFIGGAVSSSVETLG